jgi:hypothetical protein
MQSAPGQEFDPAGFFIASDNFQFEKDVVSLPRKSSFLMRELLLRLFIERAGHALLYVRSFASSRFRALYSRSCLFKLR